MFLSCFLNFCFVLATVRTVLPAYPVSGIFLLCFFCLLLLYWYSPGFCFWTSWLVMWYSFLQEYHPVLSNERFTNASSSSICSFRLAFLWGIFTLLLLFWPSQTLCSANVPFHILNAPSFLFKKNLFLLYFIYWLMILFCSQLNRPETWVLPWVLVFCLLSFQQDHSPWF